MEQHKPPTKTHVNPTIPATRDPNPVCIPRKLISLPIRLLIACLLVC